MVVGRFYPNEFVVLKDKVGSSKSYRSALSQNYYSKN
jgi:hypothetical protein